MSARALGYEEPPPRPWATPANDVLAALGVDPRPGLTEEEARARRAEFGPNVLRQAPRRGAGRILADQFASLLVGLLVLASGVAFAFGEAIEGLAIAVVIVLNAGIGFVTERRAMRSMEALRELGRVAATVRRAGRVRRVRAEDLVPGDIVVVEGGDVLTADLRLIEASKLQADESALTGESIPVTKRPDPVAEGAPLPERASMLFKGTALTRGSGEGVVVATGMTTEVGRISALVAEAEPETTPLEKRLDRLARRLIGLTLAVAAGVAVAGLLGGRDLLLMIEVSVALAVATVPEGLPIVATVALARGMWRMVRRNALMERLSAVETLGSTSVILTDKTGTLTENRMTVVEARTADGLIAISGSGLSTRGSFERDGAAIDPSRDPILIEALRVGALCSNAALHDSGKGDVEAVGDPTEVALLVAARKAGLVRADLMEKTPELREVAFEPDLKLMATVHGNREISAAVKGAPEAVLERATRVRTAAGDVALDPEGRERWRACAEEMAGRGERVLALACRTLPTAETPPYAELTLLAVVGLLDPPRERVRAALAACRDAGLRVVIVTGDHAATARSVARAVGLLDESADAPGRVVDARSLPDVSHLDEDGVRALLEAAVIARASPKQKLDLIALYQQRGAVVAMTGDGVNDAPALKKADIGIAMGRHGTQVAKQSAAMVLQDDEFGTIVAAVAQGRAIFGNIRKFCLYLLSCNVSEILAVGAGTLAQGPLPILPLQILFLNLVTDVFPALALGVGEGSPALMRRPPRDPKEPILTRYHWHAILALGGAIALAVLAALALAVASGMERQRATTIAFLTLAMAQLWHVFSMRHPDSGWLRNEITTNPWLWGALALCAALLLAAVYVPPLAEILSIADPGLQGWVIAVAMSVLPLLIGQVSLAFQRRSGV
jgi:Ca2+-transporting ATPase